uniref:Uncharacterized protein n=1 Tax=Rhipicephalus microplus TaxID=6941 RepID=A0A6M2DCZ2_RHIMP
MFCQIVMCTRDFLPFYRSISCVLLCVGFSALPLCNARNNCDCILWHYVSINGILLCKYAKVYISFFFSRER